MADRPREDDWWQASDGKWYPPDLLDAPRQEFPTTEITPVVGGFDDQRVGPGTFIQAVMIAVALAQLAVVLTGVILASDVRSSPTPIDFGDLSSFPSSVEPSATMSALQLVAMLVAIVTGLVWMQRTGRALYNRGPAGQRWSAGWALGGWFIPFANLVIPKLVIGEMERIAQVPYRGQPIGSAFKAYRRSSVGDLWWFLWLAGNVVTFVGSAGTTSSRTNAEYANYLSVEAIGGVIAAGAALAFVAVVRGIIRNANS